MTDIDLDAIRARYDAANRDTAVDPFGPAWVVASYVPALLARLAEVEAERDAALHQRDASNLIRGNLKADLAAANDALADVTRLLDEARETRNMHKERQQELVVENDLMRPVVEAVDAWRLMRTGTPTKPKPESAALIAAVDAYRAGQKATATGLSATESQDQAEPAVASTGTAQTQRGAQGEQRRYPDEQGWLIDKTTPADPPGLDAAIEAAAKAYDRWTYGEVAARHGDGMQAAVRVAAPALRAGALREAADEIHNRCQCRADEDLHCDHWRDWLRERADRIGGAT